MDKIKEALELIKTEEEGGCELYGQYLTRVRELIEQGIKELQQPIKFTITMSPGYEPMIFGVHRKD